MSNTKKKKIRNLEADTKDLGIVEGRPVVMGSKIDHNIVGLRQPEIEVSPSEWRALMANKATKTSIDYWVANEMVRVS